MKKALLFLLLAFIMQYAKAQEFNELDLLGSWELVSCEGTYPGFTTNPYADYNVGDDYGDYDYVPASKCTYLYLGVVDNSVSLPGTTGSFNPATVISGGMFYTENTNLTATEENYYDDYENISEISLPISDFSITNQNKLHIIPGGWLDFRFVIESLTADEMKLKSYDGKCTVAYKRVKDPSKVKGVNISEDSNEEYYNINGHRIAAPRKGVNIIRRGGKSSKHIK